jgi:hypothetical protein
MLSSVSQRELGIRNVHELGVIGQDAILHDKSVLLPEIREVNIELNELARCLRPKAAIS